jgi:putative oxidoreductase
MKKASVKPLNENTHPAANTMCLLSKYSPLLKRLSPVQTFAQSALLLTLRLVYGGQFVLTGRGKLMNLEKTTAFFADLHIPAPGFHAALVGSTEMIGGALLVLGLGTRLAAVPLTISMVVAYLTAHREDAFNSLDDFTSQAPYQFLLACLLLLAFGPGRAALDALVKRRYAKQFAS